MKKKKKLAHNAERKGNDYFNGVKVYLINCFKTNANFVFNLFKITLHFNKERQEKKPAFFYLKPSV